MKEKFETTRASYWLPLIISILAVSAFIMDKSMISIASPNIAEDLGTNAELIIIALAIGTAFDAGLTAAAGKISDIHGKRKTLIIGLSIFILGTVGTGLSINESMFLFSWSILKTIGAIFILPATASLLILCYKGKDRTKAFGAYGAVIGISGALGSLVIGLLSEIASWRLGFAITAAIMVTAIILLTQIKEKPKLEGATIDWTGTIILLISLFTLVYGISEPNYWYLIMFGLGFLGVFVYWSKKLEKEDRQPIFRISLFKNIQFTTSLADNTVLQMVAGGFGLTFPIIVGALGGFSAIELGILILPFTLAVFFGSMISGLLGKWFAPKVIVIISFVVIIVGMGSLFWIFTFVNSFIQIIPSLILGGFGIGINLPWLQNISLSSLEATECGEGAGVFNTMQDVGVAVAVSVIGGFTAQASIILFVLLFVGLLIALALPKLKNV